MLPKPGAQDDPERERVWPEASYNGKTDNREGKQGRGGSPGEQDDPRFINIEVNGLHDQPKHQQEYPKRHEMVPIFPWPERREISREQDDREAVHAPRLSRVIVIVLIELQDLPRRLHRYQEQALGRAEHIPAWIVRPAPDYTYPQGDDNAHDGHDQEHTLHRYRLAHALNHAHNGLAQLIHHLPNHRQVLDIR